MRPPGLAFRSWLLRSTSDLEGLEQWGRASLWGGGWGCGPQG